MNGLCLTSSFGVGCIMYLPIRVVRGCTFMFKWCLFLRPSWISQRKLRSLKVGNDPLSSSILVSRGGLTRGSLMLQIDVASICFFERRKGQEDELGLFSRELSIPSPRGGAGSRGLSRFRVSIRPVTRKSSRSFVDRRMQIQRLLCPPRP